MIEPDAHQKIETIRSTLIDCYPDDIRKAIARKTILSDPAFAIWEGERYGCFYAPFDWINEQADIVLIGITPGMQQAEAAILALQSQLKKGATAEAAACAAKSEASFKGEMRTIAARLMDHFEFQKLFGLGSTSELFSHAEARVHYTSVLRYPVLERKGGNKEWSNYSGDKKIVSRPEMKAMIENHLLAELQILPKAWLVPFGPVPSRVLEDLGRQGLIDETRVLAGLNHPSGTHWNRHNCQLDLVDHKFCASNVGCSTISQRTRDLRDKVASLL